MVFLALIKLPYNLFCELLKYSLKLENRNRGYMMYLIKEFKIK